MSKSLLLFLFISINLASANTWQINRDHSQIFFEIPYLGVSKVTGQFKRFNGSIEITDNKVKKIKANIEVDTIDTSNNMRDGHLKSKDFFHAKKFPYISFNSTQIKNKDQNTFTAMGNVTIKDITKVITLNFKSLGTLKDSWGKENLILEFNTRISRQDFGITWSKNIQGGDLLVGNTVKIYGTLQLQPRGSKTQSSKHMIPNTKRAKLVNKVATGEVSQEVLENKIKEQNQKVNTQKTYEPILKKVITSNKTHRPEKKKTILWWISFFVLSFFAFIGSILGVVTIKKLFIQKHKENYEEAGFWGYFSDIYSLIIIFIYAWAQWYLVWG